jgi:hypothetical protein
VSAPKHGHRPPGVVALDDDVIVGGDEGRGRWRLLNFRRGLVAAADGDRVDIDVQSGFVNVDYVVDPNGLGTHLTLSGADGAFQAALAAGGNKVIWMCYDASETFSDEEEVGGIDGVITIWGPTTRQELNGGAIAGAARVVLTAANDKNLFKQTSAMTGTFKGVIFKGIGFSVQSSYAILLVNTVSEIRYLEFAECTFSGGYLLQNPDAIVGLGNVRIFLRNCGGTLNALWANNRAALSTGPDQFLSDGSVITLTNWFDNAGTGTSPNLWDTKNDWWTVSNGMVIRDAPFFMEGTRVYYSGSGALFSTPASGEGSASQKDYAFTDIVVQFSHVDGVFGDFQSAAANNLEGLFIDGVYGYPTTGVTPTGTFLTIDDPDFLSVYVGDFYGRDFSPQYSGPPSTPSAPLAPEDFQWTDDIELTISGGVITVTQTHHTIDTEGDAATDDLDTINGLVANQLYFFYPANDARTVVFKHNTGNILCIGNDDIVLDDAHDFVWGFSPDGSNIYVSGAHSSTEIIDADRDTHWRAETAADEDILRATIAGTEHFRVGGTSQLDFFNGSILETTRIVVSSNGTTVTLALDQAGGGDLTLVFSDGFSTFDTTPAVSVSLTPGSDTSPQTNYVYILQSNKTLTVSTSGWPSEEHAPIAIVILQSAATTQTENALVVHLWHDHVQGSDEQGHYSHLGRWIRQHSATYESGVAQTLTITTNAGVPDNVDFATTAGEVYQMHLHAVPAFDTATGTNVHVVNDSVSPYTPVTDLADLLTDSAGGSMSGKYFNLVIWASVSEETDETHLFINLPSGSYNKEGDATDDVSGFTDFTIPDDFKGTAFLISRLTLRHQAASGGTWTSIQETDLRGLIPNLVAGGGTSAITTEFADNAFRIFDESDVTKLLAFQLSGITPGNTRTLTIPDGDGTLLLAEGLSGGQTLIGDTASGGDLTLQSTAHATRGSIFLGSASEFELDETTGQLKLPTQGSGGGLLVGGDVNLYRGAANQWKSDDNIEFAGYIKTTDVLWASGGTAGTRNVALYENFDDTLGVSGVAFQVKLSGSQWGAVLWNKNGAWNSGSAAALKDTYTSFSNLVDGAAVEQMRLTAAGELSVDAIVELTGAAGVTIESVLLKDNGITATGVMDFGGATSLEIPNSATPTVNADGEIALDTTITDFSHGLIRYYGGEELVIIAVPAAQIDTAPTDGHVLAYNATNDEFEFVAQAGGGGGHTIRENGVDLTARTGLNFNSGLIAADDAGGDESEVDLDYAAVWAMQIGV